MSERETPGTRPHVHLPEVAIGTELGGYQVLDFLGKGGMGVVYLAFDPKLQRKVALKLLRSASDTSRLINESQPLFGSDLDTQVAPVEPPAEPLRTSPNQLLREAQAMAKLSHPNVVVVYQVGEVDDRVFIAMEYIEGTTLNQWVSQTNPSVRAILDVMIKAGRGLQAAHEAGLVHRDFKADNILLGKDGRVCVTDFGLAHSSTDATDLLATLENQARNQDSFTQRAVGTPEYMAPEQHLRRSADARSDQFGYCVTLFRATLGVWPFAGETYEQYADAVTHGRVTFPHIPRSERWLRPILARGLSVDPDRRYPSMGALLAELDRKPKLLRNVLIGAGALVVASGAAVTFMMTRAPEPSSCSASETHLADVWNPSVAARVESAMLATDVPYAKSTVRGVTEAVTKYAEQWTTMHRSTCEATRRGEQSEKLLDLRMACLDRKKGELAIVIDLVSKVDKETIQHSLNSVHALSPLNDCARSESLSNLVDEPSEPAQRKKLRQLQQALDEAKAELNIGHYTQSLAKLAEIAGDIDAINYPPLQAEALLIRGRSEWRLGELPKAEATLMESLAAAERGRDDDKRLLVLSELTHLVGYEAGRVSDGLAWAKIAEAMLSRASSPERFVAELRKTRATVEFRAGRYEDALRDAKESCEILQRTLGETHRDVAECLTRIGVVLLRLGRNEEALAHQNQALPIAEAALGKQHPSLGDYLNNAGNCYASLGDMEKAASMYTQALELYRSSLGSEHTMVAVSLSNLGSLAFGQGDYKAALEHFSAAVAIEEKTLGAKHQSAAETLTNLGNTYLMLGEPDEAVAPLERAWAVYADAPAKPPEAAAVAYSFARALADTGAIDRAIKLAHKAQELAAASEGEDWKALASEIEQWLEDHPRR